LGGTRASRAGEPYTQDANVTDAAMVRLYCRTRDTLYPWTHPTASEPGLHPPNAPDNDGQGVWERRMRGRVIPLVPRNGGKLYRRAGASKSLHTMRRVPSLVRQVKGSKRHLRPHKTYDTSNAGTSGYSRNGRGADTQCTQRGREAVVTVGVTTYRGHG
jgi:hypothetical protein